MHNNKIFVLFFVSACTLFAANVDYQMEKTRKNIDTALDSFDQMEKTNNSNSNVNNYNVSTAYSNTVISKTPATAVMIDSHNEPTKTALDVASKDPLTKKNILEYLYNLAKIAPLTTGTPNAGATADKLARIGNTLSESNDPDFNSKAASFSQIATAIKSNDPIEAQKLGGDLTDSTKTNITNLDNTYKNGYPPPQNIAGMSGISSYNSNDQDVFGSILKGAGNLILGTAASALTQAGLTALFKDVLGLNLPGLSGAVGQLGNGAGTATQQSLNGKGNPVQTMNNASMGATQSVVGSTTNNINQEIKTEILPQSANPVNQKLNPVKDNSGTGQNPDGINSKK